jgi:carboxyl-terminal processing protease
MPQRNLLIVLLATVISYACYVRGEQNPFARYVSEGLTTIETNSLEQIPERQLFDGAMRGMVDVLDEHGDQHSEFLNEDAAEPMRTEIRQQFGGIGVRIGLEGEPPQLTIVGPPDAKSPAARVELRAGDRILAIDGHATAGMKMNDVLKRMRGLPGTSVQLSIQSRNAAEPRTVNFTREIINIESVLGDRRDADGNWQFLLEANPKIAHIRIVSFGERTASELRQILEAVTKQGVEGIVLDLRGDAGGSLDAAVDVCRLLLPAGKAIVETRGRSDVVHQSYRTLEDGPFRTIPMVVLVNQDSASAAEIVAACLQDHHRALVAGQRSYGKGTVQQLIPMQNGKALLKLTWASFWRPSGDTIHRGSNSKDDETWGVLPDAGLERKLSQQEYEAFLKYRAERDQIGEREEGNDSEESPENADVADFNDEQLQLAVKQLQSELPGASL